MQSSQVEKGQRCSFSCINITAPNLRAVMNYLKIYCNLIRKAENRTPPEGYTEKHHTFPKSIYGKNNRVVKLTGREHYIAHALLEKIYIKRYGVKNWKTKKMINAFWCMNSQKYKNKYLNSYLYEKSRERHSKVISEIQSARIVSKETRKKMGEWQKGKKQLSEKTKKKLLEANLGKKVSEETKKKISEKLKGRIITEETRKKMSAAQKGKKVSEETKRKLREAKKNISEETRRKMSVAKKGKKASEEARRKMSENRKGKKRSEETKKKMSEKATGKNNPFYGKKHSEETKEKIRQTLLKRRQLKNCPQ